MNNRIKKIIVCSTINSINKSKVTGSLDLCDAFTYQNLIDRLEFTKNKSKLEDVFNDLQDLVVDYENSDNGIIDNVISVLPKNPYITDSNNNVVSPGSPSPSNPLVVASNFTVTNIIQENIFGVGNFYDTYKFTISDFLNAYSDNNDGDFYAIRINRANLDNMHLKFSTSLTTGNVFGENPSWITILKNDIPKWSLFTTSTSDYLHNIQYKFVDIINNVQLESNEATLTVNRTSGENQPPTIGDNTVIVGNRAVTTFTLAMFTSQLAPPYSDPENDLIDAIRIDEISTANQGIFKLNGIVITDGQIITREDLNAGLFTHEAANIDTISSDVFSFSARDEGSQIWVS